MFDQLNKRQQKHFGTNTLAAPLLQANTAVQFVAMTLLGSGVLAASAQVQVPLLPVPMTMQPFAIMVLGLVCHWRLAMAVTVAC